MAVETKEEVKAHKKGYTLTHADFAHCPKCNGTGKQHMATCPVCEGRGHVNVKNMTDLNQAVFVTDEEEARIKTLKGQRTKTDAERAELRELELKEKNQLDEKDVERTKALREKVNKTTDEDEELRGLEEREKGV